MPQLSDALKHQAREQKEFEQELKRAREEQKRREAEEHRRVVDLAKRLRPMIEPKLRDLGDHIWGKTLGVLPRYTLKWLGDKWKLEARDGTYPYYELGIHSEGYFWIEDAAPFAHTTESAAEPLSGDALTELLLSAARYGPYGINQPTGSNDNY